MIRLPLGPGRVLDIMRVRTIRPPDDPSKPASHLVEAVYRTKEGGTVIQGAISAEFDPPEWGNVFESLTVCTRYAEAGGPNWDATLRLGGMGDDYKEE